MTITGFGLAQVKTEGMSFNVITGLSWYGHTEKMEKLYDETWNRWYYWPIKKLLRSAFTTAWQGGLEEEAYQKELKKRMDKE